MTIKVPPFKPALSEQDIEEAVNKMQNTLKSGWLTGGPVVKEFEKTLARYLNVKHVIAVNNGTAALTCALKALNIPESIILVPDNTMAATVHAVVWSKGNFSLIDIDDENTFNVGVNSLEKTYLKASEKFGEDKIKGVIVVHISGHPVDMNPVKEFCDKKNLKLVEDAAHALGSEYMGAKCATLSDAGCISLYPTKIMTTGEGGLIVTNQDKIAEECRIILDQGRHSLYTSDTVLDGFNFRMSDINACLGLVQIKKLNGWIEQRRKMAELYNELLANCNWIELPQERKYAKNNYYKFTCKIKKESKFSASQIKEKLKEKGVSCGAEVFVPPIHKTSFYRTYSQGEEFPVCDELLPRQLCLPMYSTIAEKEIEYVSEQIHHIGD